jgi:hypothetical protein
VGTPPSAGRSYENDGDVHAVIAMTAASRTFDDLDEPEDWAVAQ